MYILREEHGEMHCMLCTLWSSTHTPIHHIWWVVRYEIAEDAPLEHSSILGIISPALQECIIGAAGHIRILYVCCIHY